MAFLLRVLAALLASCTIIYAQKNSPTPADRAFREAEQYFNAPNPTHATDSLAMELYQKAIRIFRQSGAQNLRYGNCFTRMGSLFQVAGNLQEATRSYRQAVAVKKLLPLPDSVLFRDYIFLGNIQFMRDRFDSALVYYSKAEELATRYQSLHEVERIYNSMGLYYYRLGNFNLSIKYFEQALALKSTADKDYNNAYVSFNNNLALSLDELGRYEEAIRKYRNILNKGIQADVLYQNLGRCYTELGQYDSASFFIRQSLNSSSRTFRIGARKSLGEVYQRKGQYDSAFWYYEESMRINREGNAPKPLLLAQTYLGMARAEFSRNHYEQALLYLDDALENNRINIGSGRSEQGAEDKEPVISLLLQYRILREKARVLQNWFDESGKHEYLHRSLDNFQRAIATARNVQRSYDSDNAKLFFIKQVYPVFGEAVEVTYRLYEQTGADSLARIAFDISEKSRAAVLAEIIRELSIKKSGVVDSSLIAEDKLVRQQITATRLQMVETSNNRVLERLENKLTELEIARARVVSRLQQNSKYYQLKYSEQTADLDELTDYVTSNDAAMLEYLVGNEFVHIFYLDQDGLKWKRVSRNEEFMESLIVLRQGLYQYRAGQRYAAHAASHTLYQRLLGPFEEEISRRKRLIIIPEGVLNFIPYDVLEQTKEVNSFLLYDYSVSYAYSANLLINAAGQRQQANANKLLAMAPFSADKPGKFRNSEFEALAASRKEVERIGGNLYFAGQATKQRFLEVAGSHQIIHLATHAKANSEEPLQSFIAFYPDSGNSSAGHRLYTDELYNLELDSVQLVVLSACEAASGRLERGEGIISLARAFAYAGCPNIVSTLWQAADESTADITSSMHDYLKQGYYKDEALRQAKIDYLESNAKEKSPYYWANFVFIGDPYPVYDKGFNWFHLIPLSIALLFGGFLFLRFRTGK